ncbi:MAG: hypothetical protein WC715_05860 [Patescibacteria group bacterium]|jgi:hypothetical protein
MEKHSILAKKISNLAENRIIRDYGGLLLTGAKIATVVFTAAFILAVSAPFALSAGGLGTNVKQAKTKTGTTVYYLDHKRGLKKSYTSAAAFLSYGNKWGNIKTVSQSQLDSFAAANLIKTAGSPGVYYIYGSKKALIESEAQFNYLGFDWDGILTVTNLDFNSYKTVSLDELINNVSSTKDSSSEIEKAPEPQKLTITPDNSSPKDGVVIFNTKDNLVGVFGLTSNIKEKVKISKIVFDLKGAASAEDIKNIYLANEAGTKYDNPYSLDGRKISFNLSDSGIFILPGQTIKLKVYFDLAGGKINQGHVLQIAVNSADYISSNVKFSGNFPLASGRFNIIEAGTLLPKATVAEESLAGYNSQAIIGATEQVVAKFTVSETSKNDSLVIKKIILKNKGTARPETLKNFKLKNKNGKILAQAGAMDANASVTFILDDYEISKYSKDAFTVLADIADGEGKNYNFNVIDASVFGKSLDYAINPEITAKDETFNIKREYLGVVAKDLKASKNIFSKEKGVIIGNFEIRNNNKKISLQSLEFELTKSAKAPVLDSTVFLANYETGEIYGSVEGSKLSAGKTAVSLIPVAIEAKKTLVVTLITDIPQYANAGDYYQAILSKINYSGENGLIYSDEVEAPGVKLTVSKSAIYVYPNKELKGLTYIKGQKGITIANFIIETSAGEDVAINGITFAMGASSGLVSYENGFSNLRAYINGARVGEVIASPFGAAFEINGFNYKVRAGNRYELKVVADTVSDLRVSETQMALNQITAAGYTSGIPATVSGINIQSYSVYFDVSQIKIDAKSGGSAAAGQKKNLVASFSVANEGVEDVSLKNVTIVTSDAGFSYSLGYSNLKIVKRSDNYQIGNISKPVAGANRLGMSNALVKSGEEITFDVYVDADSDVLPGTFEVYFIDLAAKGEVSELTPKINGDPTGSATVIVN